MYNANEITNGIDAGFEERKARGLEIAALARIEKVDGFWMVPSVTSPKPVKYKVKIGKTQDKCSCDCLDHEIRGCICKHIYAVRFVIKRERHSDGSTTVTESVTIEKTRKTYPQNWPAYNAAQQNEKQEFQSLLADLCKGLDKPSEEKPGRGRPKISMADAVFSIVYKVYSTFSGRRFTSDLCDAESKGLISRVPHYNTAFKYIEKAELFPILLSLIEQSSLPLKAVETKFAVDSTGFAYSRFVRWYDIKYNRFTSEQQWVKAHLMCGVKTNIVTSVEIHGRDTSDSPQLPSLVEKTAKNFSVNEVSADKGYSSQENINAVVAIGADPYIMFKANATGKIGGKFEKAFHFFSYHRDTFLAHYHQRSNVESTMMMIKTKFGDAVRSKSEVAAKNEVLCKVLCHNLCCLIGASYELGIQSQLGLEN